MLYESCDMMIGYRADDSYFSFAQDFINGTISYRQLNNALHLGRLGQQFVFKSRTAFDRIQFVGSEAVECSEWYAKKCCAIRQLVVNISAWSATDVGKMTCISRRLWTRR